MSIAELLGGFIMVNISRRNVLISTAFAGMTGLSGTASAAAAPCSAAMPKKWNYEADVVIIGAGAVGLPAAIGARDAGLSVLVVDANYDIGGHAITSGGNVPLGSALGASTIRFGSKVSPQKALPAPAEHSLCAVLRLRQERREFSFCSTITWMNSTERLRGTAEWLD